MKIGILTFHRAYNCGAMLQAWALQTVLEESGHVVEFPDCNHVGETPVWRKPVFSRPSFLGKIRNLCGYLISEAACFGIPFIRRYYFHSFLNRYLKHSYHTIDELKENYDVLIVGSDQVWNPDLAGKWYSLYIGLGIDEKIPMIGYALSSGEYTFTSAELFSLEKQAKRFSALSFREENLKNILKFVDSSIVCDPTLLLDVTQYKEVEYPNRLVKEKYLFLYSVSNAPGISLAAQQLADRLHVKLVVANVYQHNWNWCEARHPKNNYFALTPDKMLALIRDAEYVVVSSFHGCIFSMLYHKPFINLCTNNIYYGRQYELLARYSLKERRVLVNADITEMEHIIKLPYEINLNILRSDGKRWLQNALATLHTGT